MSRMKIIVAYSGGLDTSVMVKWLKDKYDAEIITATGFLGQVKEIEGVKEKAAKTGAFTRRIPYKVCMESVKSRSFI